MKSVNLLLGAGSAVIGVGIAWGMLTSRLSAQESKMKQLEDLPEQIATLNEKVGNLEDMSKEMRGDIKTLLRDSMPPPNR